MEKVDFYLRLDQMGLNIKSADTHRRAKELARLAGETMTQAVDRAISERLDRIRKKRNREGLLERLLEIGHECASLPILDKRSPEEMLYDARGLPKSSLWTRRHRSPFWMQKTML